MVIGKSDAHVCDHFHILTIKSHRQEKKYNVLYEFLMKFMVIVLWIQNSRLVSLMSSPRLENLSKAC